MAYCLTERSPIQELRIERDGKVYYVYFARLGDGWVDLALYGNSIPTFDLTEGVAQSL